MYSCFPRMSHNIVGAWLVLTGREEVRAEVGHGPASVCLTGMNRYSTDGMWVCGWAFSGAEEQGRLHLAETT